LVLDGFGERRSHQQLQHTALVGQLHKLVTTRGREGLVTHVRGGYTKCPLALICGNALLPLTQSYKYFSSSCIVHRLLDVLGDDVGSPVGLAVPSTDRVLLRENTLGQLHDVGHCTYCIIGTLD